jgi:hypothetical protein
VDHAIQLSLLPALLRRLQLARTLTQHAGQMNSLLNYTW